MGIVKWILTVCVVIVVVIVALGIYYYNQEWNGNDDLSKYEGLAWADMPDACLEFNGDACGMFECSIENCWCDELVDGPMLWDSGSPIQNEDEAKILVQDYLDVSGAYIDYPSPMEVKKAVKLNEIFYNVFVENGSGEEFVYTVVVDGSIIQTQCGV